MECQCASTTNVRAHGRRRNRRREGAGLHGGGGRAFRAFALVLHILLGDLRARERQGSCRAHRAAPCSQARSTRDRGRVWWRALPRTCPARSSTPLLAGEAGISATLESGRTMSWATPTRSHVVVTMMARSITVERSVPALLGLARVSGLGAARVFHLSGLEGGPPRILYRGTRVPLLRTRHRCRTNPKTRQRTK